MGASSTTARSAPTGPGRTARPEGKFTVAHSGHLVPQPPHDDGADPLKPRIEAIPWQRGVDRDPRNDAQDVQFASGAYVNTFASGTPGVGTTLTSSGHGSVVEIDTMLQNLWDLYQVSPTVLWVNSQQLKDIEAALADLDEVS